MDPQDRPGWNPPELPSFEPTSPGTPDVVASSSSGPRRSRIGTGIAIGAIAIGALGVAGTAYASSSSPTPAPGTGSQPGYGAPSGTASPGARPGMGMGHDGMRGGPGMGPGMGSGMGTGPGMGLGAAIHGSYVTPKQGGGYQTVDVQRGTVSAVSSSSITVKSVDGFSQTYVVKSDTKVHANKDGIGSIKVGDEVGVVAVENGSAHEAVQIVDRTQLGDLRGGFGGKRGAAPSPTPSTTA